MTVQSSPQIRLLLVDDEAEFRATLIKRMRRRGIDTWEADSGSACLNELAQRSFDVVVLDVKMPDMNGIEVLHTIKTHYPDVEVILLTGHADTRDGVEGIKSGAFDYLTKPIEFEHLLEKVRHAQEKKARHEERRQEAAYKARIEQQMITTERLAALGTLAAGVAHEINNPLAIINEAAGYLDSLLNKSDMSDIPRRQDMTKALEKIKSGVKRARVITHQLLGSVKKQGPQQVMVDLDDLVEEVISLVRHEASDRLIEISKEFSRKMPECWIDPNLVRQILINLLTNAIHATDRHGRVTIGIERQDKDIILTVTDTGKGIAKENFDKIFEPFFSNKPPGEGTGLGLFVTRQIVDRLNGTISVNSRLGKGTTMTVRIPPQSMEPSGSA